MAAKLLIVLLVASACHKTEERSAPADPCGAVAGKVEELYAALDYGVGSDAGALVAELVAANRDMVLKDCRKNPEKFAPCLRKATTVGDIEKNCVIPLDDEGTVEASDFESKAGGPNGPKARR